MERRALLKMLAAAFAAPWPALRALADPLRALPSAVADLTPNHLIGSSRPRLERPRWSEVQLLPEAAEALAELTRAARGDGVEVWARSGHRSLAQQRYLWNSKFRGQAEVRGVDGTRAALGAEVSEADKVRRILAYTAFPGTSRHHWGTDVDMAQTYSDACADLLAAPSGVMGGVPEVEPGAGRKAEGGAADDCRTAQEWLLQRAGEFGWCLVYDTPRGGFQPEPWHWSYLPLAVPALARFLQEVTVDMLRERDIDGDRLVLDDFEAYRRDFLLGIQPAARPAS